ncbi:starvation sensing protein RspB [Aquitalea magnusonii]|uniref:Starvation sensing protein RspB n=1 Tax=Aquitalea magnusonii TaxID=332411 RepID=A0A3G9GFC5_9NEIS|nr:Zn-dependent oxidoreductase [Aquitalea magnusonii]BBF84327.1 starvation sensing protein RspB [Aquitalea magnusonii]
MKSIVISQPGVLEIQQREIPQPADDEVRVKVIYAGVCGSDVHIYHGHNPFARYPRVIGHEFFGVIDQVGRDVMPSRIGQHVVIDPVVSCGQCYPCSVGRPNVCLNLQVIGVHRDGGFSEFACVPASNAHIVPKTIPALHAALVEPFSIAANITAQLKPTAQDVALVYGAGPMGLAVIQVLKKVFGVAHLVATDRIASRLDRAIECGADQVVTNQDAYLLDYFQQYGRAPTLIVDAACHPAILQQAIELASPAGRIGIMGFSDAPCMISQKDLTSKELAIFSSRLNSARFPQVICWMGDGKLNPDALITHKLDFNQVGVALHLFENEPAECCKILLEFPG